MIYRNSSRRQTFAWWCGDGPTLRLVTSWSLRAVTAGVPTLLATSPVGARRPRKLSRSSSWRPPASEKLTLGFRQGPPGTIESAHGAASLPVLLIHLAGLWRGLMPPPYVSQCPTLSPHQCPSLTISRTSAADPSFHKVAVMSSMVWCTTGRAAPCIRPTRLRGTVQPPPAGWGRPWPQWRPYTVWERPRPPSLVPSGIDSVQHHGQTPISTTPAKTPTWGQPETWATCGSTIQDSHHRWSVHPTGLVPSMPGTSLDVVSR